MFVRTLLGASALGTGYGIWKHQNDEGFNRSVALWTKLGPIVAHYRFVELRQKQFPPANEDDKKAEWDALHQKYADKTVSMLRNMQGMYTKYGQVSAGLTDTFPKLWIEKLRTLEDKVTPQPTNVVAKTILEDTGKSIEELFVEFDDVPLGSASIGQVHRARLRRDGREVAVKVQYPHSLRLFRGDMATIRGFFEIAAPEQVITLSELEKMFAEEFDYRREAINLEDVDANMRRAGFVPSIAVVPLPLQELCTQRVLVMDLLKGQKLVDGVRELVTAVAAKEGKTRDLFEKEMMAKIEAEGLPAQYEGPSAFAISLYKSWLTTYDTTFNSFAFLYNWMIGHWVGSPLSYANSTSPLNTPLIVDRLMQIHGRQLLKDGVFNADPHAGNFLLVEDGRIGLIDYGATKRLTRAERLTACALFAALKRRDKDMIKNIALAGGYKSKYMDMDVIFTLVEFGFDSFGRDVTNGKNIQQMMDELYAKDPYEEVAGNLIMSQFLTMRLRSMCMQMGFPLRISHYWGDVAEHILKEEGCPYEAWSLQFATDIMKDDVRMVKGGRFQ